MLFHQPTQALPCKRSVFDLAYVTGTISDFPRFTNLNIRWQLLSIKSFEVPSAPNPLFEDGNEFQGIEHDTPAKYLSRRPNASSIRSQEQCQFLHRCRLFP